MSERDAAIAPTAHYTAHVWKRLGLPYATMFATREGARLFWTLRLAGEWLTLLTPKVPTMVEYLAQRHLLIEAALEDLSPDRIVELGAGLSRRGVTWAVDKKVRYLEVDLPHMVRAKQAAIDTHLPPRLRADVRARLELASCDVLSEELPHWLAARLAESTRPVVVAEGLVGYFAPNERDRLASGIAAALRAVGGGAFVCDLRSTEGGKAIARARRGLELGIKLITRGRGSRADFLSEDDVRAFFRRAGFTSAEPMDRRRVGRVAHTPSPARIWVARV